MSNKYANLSGPNRISDEYELINEGFDGVQADMEDAEAAINQNKSDLNSHKSSTQAHSAAAITYTGDVIGATTAKQAIDSVQTQINAAIFSGDSSEAAAQAAVDASGHNYGNLKVRLDTEHTQLASQLADTTNEIERLNDEKAGKNEVNALASEKADKTQVNALSMQKADVTYVEDLVAGVSDGTPESFVNLAAIQAAYPTGSNYVKLNLEDGYIYKWDGTQWVQGWKYQETGIGNNTVTPEKTTFINTSTNLFNKDAVLLGYGINTTTGEPVENSTAALSPFIVVEAGLYYTVSINVRVAFYDNLKTFISSHINSSAVATIQAPSNAKSCRLVVQQSRLNTAQLNLGSTLLPYEPFYQAIDKNIIRGLGSENLEDKAATSKKRSVLGQLGLIALAAPKYVPPNIDLINRKVIFTKGFAITYNNSRYTFSGTGTVEVTLGATASFQYIVFNTLTNEIRLVIASLENTIAEDEFIIMFLQFRSNAQGLINVFCGCPVTVNGLRYEKYLDQFHGDALTTFGLNKDIPLGYYKTVKPSAQGNPGDDFNYLTTKSADVYAKYDALAVAYPNYITKTLFGMDESGTLPVYRYDFVPERVNYTGTNLRKALPKILLTSGLHGNSDVAIGDLPTGDPHMHIFAMYYFFEDICNNWRNDEVLEYLRWNVRFSIIPIANPWGMDNNSRANYNNVDINRNFDYNWETETNSHKGTAPFSEVESQYIRDFILSQKEDNVVCHMDYHCIGGNSYVSDSLLLRYLVTNEGNAMFNVSEQAISNISRNWKKNGRGFVNDLSYYGRIDVHSPTPTAYYWINNTVGIPSMLIESFRQTNREAELGRGQFSSESVEMNVEGLGNWLMSAVRYFAK